MTFPIFYFDACNFWFWCLEISRAQRRFFLSKYFFKGTLKILDPQDLKIGDKTVSFTLLLLRGALGPLVFFKKKIFETGQMPPFYSSYL